MTRSSGTSIISGERPQKQSSSPKPTAEELREKFGELSDSTDSGSPQANQAFPIYELQELLLLIVETVTSLLKLSTPPRLSQIRAMSQTTSEVVAISHSSRESDEDSNSKTTLQSSTPVNNDPLPDLYVALTRGDVDLVEKLLENDADDNERSLQDAGLRQVAATYGISEALEILLGAGADAARRRS